MILVQRPFRKKNPCLPRYIFTEIIVLFCTADMCFFSSSITSFLFHIGRLESLLVSEIITKAPCEVLVSCDNNVDAN